MNLLKPYYVWRPSQVILRFVREYHRPSSAVVTLPWGGRLRINPTEAIGAAIWKTGVHELATTETIFRLLPRGGLGVDVGANIGYMTTAMAAVAGSNGHVLAFEPHPAVFERLRENVELNRKSRAHDATVDVFCLALSDTDGTANLVNDQGGENQGMARIAEPGANGDACEVSTRLLDDFPGGRRISLLKLDVEGHELQVLRGARTLLEQQLVDHIVFEDHQGTGSPVHEWLASFGYAIFKLSWELTGPRLLPASAPGSHVTYQAQDFLATLRPADVTSCFKEKGWRCFSPR